MSPPPTSPRTRQVELFLRDWFAIEFDVPYERSVWKGRLGFAIGAVLSITQFSMVFFADAYFPNWLRNRSLSRERRERLKRRGRAEPPVPHQREHTELPHPDVEMHAVEHGRSSPRAAVGGTPPRSPVAAAVEASRNFTARLSRSQRASGASRPPSSSERWGAGGRMSDLLDEAQMPPYDPMLDYAGCVIQVSTRHPGLLRDGRGRPVPCRGRAQHTLHLPCRPCVDPPATPAATAARSHIPLCVWPSRRAASCVGDARWA